MDKQTISEHRLILIEFNIALGAWHSIGNRIKSVFVQCENAFESCFLCTTGALCISIFGINFYFFFFSLLNKFRSNWIVTGNIVKPPAVLQGDTLEFCATCGDFFLISVLSNSACFVLFCSTDRKEKCIALSIEHVKRELISNIVFW